MNRLLGVALALPLLSASVHAAAPPPCEPELLRLGRAIGRLEGVQMASAILRGQPVGAGSGWFKPSETPYDFAWLAAHFDANGDGVITPDELKGQAAFFERLDRDRDGKVTVADFDWSERSPFLRQARQADMLFRLADKSSDGRISAEEWQALFRKAARGKDHLTPEDLRELLSPSSAQQPRPKGGPAAGMPSSSVLLGGLLNGEIGSVAEGPRIGRPAPGFRLRVQDGSGFISLADYRGKKPVVLVFGSFT